mmetsp:Transcript_42073/g.82304  ORF Transcript_42073/g.82304 Transcript_42073/m.82304 type:complete len:313 (-) Transcript_42073:195-1133(-)
MMFKGASPPSIQIVESDAGPAKRNKDRVESLMFKAPPRNPIVEPSARVLGKGGSGAEAKKATFGDQQAAKKNADMQNRIGFVRSRVEEAAGVDPNAPIHTPGPAEAFARAPPLDPQSKSGSVVAMATPGKTLYPASTRIPATLLSPTSGAGSLVLPPNDDSGSADGSPVKRKSPTISVGLAVPQNADDTAGQPSHARRGLAGSSLDGDFPWSGMDRGGGHEPVRRPASVSPSPRSGDAKPEVLSIKQLMPMPRGPPRQAFVNTSTLHPTADVLGMPLEEPGMDIPLAPGPLGLQVDEEAEAESAEYHSMGHI